MGSDNRFQPYNCYYAGNKVKAGKKLANRRAYKGECRGIAGFSISKKPCRIAGFKGF